MPNRVIAVLLAALAHAACADDHPCADASCSPPGPTGGGAGAGGGPSDVASDYCDCMLTVCHDAYHATYGPESDEALARSTCLTEAASLPEAGMDVDSGHFIECLLHHCALGIETPETCAAAVGAGVCAQ
jgi:hypothetical protein